MAKAAMEVEVEDVVAKPEEGVMPVVDATN